MKKKVIFFEVQGGSDKGSDGHRKDTMPMVNALIDKGYPAEVVFFDVARLDEIYHYVKDNAVAYVSRINPGNLHGEAQYFSMLRALCEDGVIGMPHPDAMTGYGAKDALVKLTDTSLVPTDTYAYYTMSEFFYQFPKALLLNERVLKQNRGSTGEGIWRVQLAENVPPGVTEVPLSTKIKCTEATDNHVEYWKLGEFMLFCEQYIIGDGGMLVDMPFLPRIKEGEIRLFMLRDTPINVVHKKPAVDADAFSATLFSGAQYRYDPPILWEGLINDFLSQLPTVKEKLGNYDLPLIWTADFILSDAPDGSDDYVLGEMNCSCVGFTSELSLAPRVADEIIACIKEREQLKA